MTIRTFFTALVLSLSLTATAQFVTVAQAYEVELSSMTVPIHNGGSLVFRECEDCEAMTIRITGSTRFVVNGQDIGLQEFRNRLLEARNRDGIPVTVLHHIESNTISSVSVRF